MKKLFKLLMVIFVLVGILALSVAFYTFPALLAIYLSQPLWYLLYIIHGLVLLLMVVTIFKAKEIDGYDQ